MVMGVSAGWGWSEGYVWSEAARGLSKPHFEVRGRALGLRPETLDTVIRTATEAPATTERLAKAAAAAAERHGWLVVPLGSDLCVALQRKQRVIRTNPDPKCSAH